MSANGPAEFAPGGWLDHTAPSTGISYPISQSHFTCASRLVAREQVSGVHVLLYEELLGSRIVVAMYLVRGAVNSLAGLV